MSDAAPETNLNSAHWEHAVALEKNGATREQIETALQGRGLDAESVRVLINSLPGAKGQSVLPVAQLDMSTNPLSGGAFSTADIGLQGPRKVVGTYWVAFGLVLALILGGVMAADAYELTQEPLQLGVRYVIRAGMGAAGVAVAFGIYKLITPEN